ncbi:MAG: CDP-diacylglycerol--glycerol-3-phosphate 3-phosphatidyltransferase [Candidatus Omnitrophota bacterium]
MSLPNYITLGRILLIPFFFTTLLSYQPGHESTRWAAFAIFLFARLTDALDGFLARALKSKTQLGCFLDPLADKLLLLSGFLGLLFVPSLPYRPPLWITVTVVFRDLLLVAGMILIFLASGQLRVHPNIWGKCATACQMATLVAILAAHPAAVPLWYLMAGLTIFSGFTYIFRDFIKLKL